LPATLPATVTGSSPSTSRRPWRPAPPPPTRPALCICVAHPTTDAGRFQSPEPDAPFVISGSYLAHHRVEDPVKRDGLQMTFTGWRHPLESYARALEDAGLLIDRLREPPAPGGAVAARPSSERWRRLPMFLHLRAVKVPCVP
jgi:hypothetical protein